MLSPTTIRYDVRCIQDRSRVLPRNRAGTVIRISNGQGEESLSQPPLHHGSAPISSRVLNNGTRIHINDPVTIIPGSPQLVEEWLAGLERTKSALPVWLPEVDLIHPRLVTQERVPLWIGQTYIALAGFHRVPLPRSNSTPVSPSCRRNRCVPCRCTAPRRFPTLYATLSHNSPSPSH